MIPFIDLSCQHRPLEAELERVFTEVLRGSQYILGPALTRFEKQMARLHGVRHAIGVASGTDALLLGLLGAGVRPGDEVITTPFTFVATAEVIEHAGARPVFVDIDAATFNLDPAQIEARLTERTRAIIPVHLYGQPAEMDPILDLARKHNLRVIEDAAQAHGAEYRGRRAGTLGDVACFSFYPGKNLGAYGDAGALVTNNAELAERARMLRDHGRRDKYEHLIVGYGYRLDALQAAILGAKLPHLDAWNARRRGIADYYTELFSNTDIVTPYVPPHITPVYHIYCIRAKNRDGLRQHLKARGIETGIHYPIPLHLQPVYANLGYKVGDFPHAEKAASEIISLPMYPELTDAQVEGIVEAVREFCA